MTGIPEPGADPPAAQAGRADAVLRGELLEPAGARQEPRAGTGPSRRERRVPGRDAQVPADEGRVAPGVHRYRDHPVRHRACADAAALDPGHAADGLHPGARSRPARGVRNAVHLGAKPGERRTPPSDGQSRPPRGAPGLDVRRRPVSKRGDERARPGRRAAAPPTATTSPRSSSSTTAEPTGRPRSPAGWREADPRIRLIERLHQEGSGGRSRRAMAPPPGGTSSRWTATSS